MNGTPWWDIAGLAVIGVVCAVMIVRRIRQTVAVTTGAGCCGCANGCGAEGGAATKDGTTKTAPPC